MPKFVTGETWLRPEALDPPYFVFQLGDAKVHVLPEGSFTADPRGIFGDQGLFGQSQEAEDARAMHLQKNGTLDEPMMFAAMLVQVDGKNVLLDSCLGEVMTPSYVPVNSKGLPEVPHPLLETMQRHCKLSPEDVDFVIHTHLHGDQIGWNVRHPPENSGDTTPVVTFPNAKHLIQQSEWAYPAKRFACPWWQDWSVKCAPLESKGMLKLVKGDTSVLPSVSVFASRGHTPGHQCVRIESNGKVGYYIGDALHTVLQVTWPELSPVFDCCGWSEDVARKLGRPNLPPDAAVTARLALLQRIHAEDAVMLSPHLPFPGIGRLRKMRNGRYEWVPVTAAMPSDCCCAAGFMKACVGRTHAD